MKTKTLLLAWLLLCLCRFAQAQTQNSLPGHQLALTFDPIYKEFFLLENSEFFPRNPISIGVLYKQPLNESSSLRFALSGLFINKYFDNVTISEKTDYEGIALQFKIGYGWERPLTNRFKLGYGVDVAPYYFYDETDFEKEFLDANHEKFREVSKSNGSTLGLAIQPFVDVQFAISPSFSIGLESKASLNVGKNKYHLRGTINEVNEEAEQRGTVTAGHKKLETAFFFMPVSSIQFIHNF